MVPLEAKTLGREFNKLINELKPTLKKICAKNRFLGFIDKDDLYQEALINLWNNFSNGQLEGKNTSYMLRGSYFRIQNYIRTHKVQANTLSLEEPVVCEGEEFFSLKDILKDKSGNFIGQLNSRFIAHDIMNNGLTERERDVFSLLYEGLTMREIAKRLRISHVRVLKIKQNINLKYASYYRDDL